MVASGADSLVVGETDVLSQVRTAFTSTSGDLRAFGDAAIAAGREARRRVGGEARDAGHQLDIALASAGVQPPHSVVIVGTGAMAGHLARRARELEKRSHRGDRPQLRLRPPLRRRRAGGGDRHRGAAGHAPRLLPHPGLQGCGGARRAGRHRSGCGPSLVGDRSDHAAVRLEG